MKKLNNANMLKIIGGEAPLNCNQILALAYLNYGLGNGAAGDFWMQIYEVAC